MTWLGPDVMVRGWTPEGHILFVTTYGQPFFRNYRGYTLDPLGATPQPLGYGQVNHLAFGPGNAKLIGRNTADPARWKRYRGGTAGHFWIDTSGAGTFRRMAELEGNLTSPMWIGSRIYFLSDAEGVGNLYSCRPDGSDVRRHSDHADYYARHAQTDGTRVVYQCGADIWRFDPAQDRTVRVDIDLPSHRTQAARKFVPASEHLGTVHVHPAATASRSTHAAKCSHSRCGKAPFASTGHRRGPLPARAMVRRRRDLVAIGDGSGEERVEVFEGGVTRTLPWDVGRVSRCAPRQGQACRPCQPSQRGAGRRCRAARSR
jgi:tricorn protease